ncbi:MAG TPA: thiamine-phosphate kinase [Bacteroidales bacterium]|nr:thiamine-phosphate kinase [Bacteroidales bacterium]
MEERTELETIGEFGLIERLNPPREIRNESTIIGIGDDAAALKYNDKIILVSTDAMVEGVHFDMTYTPLKHLGHKACVINFSDIYAMNGTPKQITITISASNRFSVEALEELYSGIHLACEKYNVDIVGGDTCSSSSGLFISITVIGEVDEDKIVKRSGAKPNDLLCVTGDLGGAYAGLLVLEREKVTYQANPNFQPDFSTYEYILERQLKPEAQKETIEWFKENDVLPSSMIDISDGLASETLHLCKSSDVGCELYIEKLPIDYQTVKTLEEFKIVPDVGALNGGEDYELLFTADQKDFDKIEKNENIKVIGYITDKSQGNQLITPQNTTIELRAQGWNHYRKEDK